MSKLIKQPEPLNVDAMNPSKNTVSRNGLLLLSTKRGGTMSSSLASGLLNTKTSAAPKPINTSSLKSETILSVIGSSATAPVVWQRNHPAIDNTKVQAGQQGTYVLIDTPQKNTAGDADRFDATTEINGGYVEEGTDDRQTVTIKQETQEEYMARLARERSEKRKEEDELRIREQREKAERRLLELESKMKNLRQSVKDQAKSEVSLHSPKSFYTRQADNIDTADEYVDIVDHSAGYREKADTYHDRENAKISRPSRSLFDPYRPLSVADGRITSTQSHANKGSRDAMLSNDRDGLYDNADSSDRKDLPVVQLSSYDYSSRGDRRNTSSTRMLFDPKSGSMVSVRVRDEADSTRPKKDKGKVKSKSSDEKDVKKNELKEKKKVQKRSDRKDATKLEERLQQDHTLNASRLPRTCGVLYKRELDGNVVSADGCHGDQGFGSHSVPGGRIKNASAHSELMDEQFMFHMNGNNFDAFHDTSFHSHGHSIVQESTVPELSLGLKLTRDHFMKSQSSKKLDAITVSNASAEPLPLNLRVKPNEKIELVTGIDESPTLQATAAAWAPSLSTIAALKQTFSRPQTPEMKFESHSESSELDEISESEVPVLTLVDLDGTYEELDAGEEDDSPSLLGLGFDPALNMHSVMMSPSLGQNEIEPQLNVDSLILTESAVKKFDTVNEIGSSTHFLSAAWPSSGSLGNLNNWDYLNTKTKSSTVDAIPSSLNVMQSTVMSSFLPLSLTKGENSNTSTSTHSLLDRW